MKATFILFTLILITGCNGHPAAGEWLSDTQTSPMKIVINFDGKAEIYEKSQQLATYHCFWAAYDKNSINLDCGTKKETEKAFTFEMTSSSAELKEGQALVSTFTKVII